ncbi:hypothetical protein EI94DRAFT_1700667 [Lactarius quietus]|nr:hypothetical protein EI94DRAFT_1700667 [Lactarius quietus]
MHMGERDRCRRIFIPVDFHERSYAPYAPWKGLPPMYFKRLFSDHTLNESNQPPTTALIESSSDETAVSSAPTPGRVILCGMRWERAPTGRMQVPWISPGMADRCMHLTREALPFCAISASSAAGSASRVPSLRLWDQKKLMDRLDGLCQSGMNVRNGLTSVVPFCLGSFAHPLEEQAAGLDLFAMMGDHLLADPARVVTYRKQLWDPKAGNINESQTLGIGKDATIVVPARQP